MDLTLSSLSHIPLEDIYTLLRPITVTPSSSEAVFQNWGRTFRCTPLAVFEPETEYQCELILELARREGQTVRAVGVGHSPSDLACTSGYMVRMGKLNNIIEVSIAEEAYLVCTCLSLRYLSSSETCPGCGVASSSGTKTDFIYPQGQCREAFCARPGWNHSPTPPCGARSPWARHDQSRLHL